MTSVYQQEKLYPEIPPTTRIDTDTLAYRLKKIEEAEKLKKRGNLAKRFKRRAMASEIAFYITTGSAVPLGAASTVISSTGFGAAVGIPLRSTAAVLGLSTKPIRRMGQVLYIKTAINEKIKTLAESKLDSISDRVSKAVEDANISH